MKKILFSVSTFLISSFVFGQVEVGVNANLIKFSQNDGGYSFFGPGVNITYAADEEGKVSYFGGINYFLPKKNDYILTGVANSSNTSPYTIDVNATSKTSILHFRIGAKYLFAGDNSSDFGFYGSAEGSLLLSSSKWTVGSYDSQNYYAGIDDGQKDNASQVMIGLGLGFQKLAGTGHIFGEGFFRFPAGTYNSRTGYEGEVSIVKHLYFSAGYRLPLGGGGY